MTMNDNEALKAAMTDAMQAPERAAARGEPLTAAVLCRASLAKRLSDAHERMVRESKVLAEETARLVVTLQCDGIGARLSGHSFASQARKVSGALIRLTECREIFRTIEAHGAAAVLFATRETPQLGEGDEPGVEAEEEEGNEIEGSQED